MQAESVGLTARRGNERPLSTPGGRDQGLVSRLLYCIMDEGRVQSSTEGLLCLFPRRDERPPEHAVLRPHQPPPGHHAGAQRHCVRALLVFPRRPRSFYFGDNGVVHVQRASNEHLVCTGTSSGPTRWLTCRTTRKEGGRRRPAPGTGRTLAQRPETRLTSEGLDRERAPWVSQPHVRK